MARLLPLFAFLVACASASENPFRPSVTITQLNEMSFGATTSAPITIEVHVRNSAAQPMTLRTVKLEGGLTQQYLVTPAERAFRDVLEPGETTDVRLLVTLVSQQGRIQDPEPLNLRGYVTYEVGGKQYQDLYLFRTLLQ